MKYFGIFLIDFGEALAFVERSLSKTRAFVESQTVVFIVFLLNCRHVVLREFELVLPRSMLEDKPTNLSNKLKSVHLHQLGDIFSFVVSFVILVVAVDCFINDFHAILDKVFAEQYIFFLNLFLRLLPFVEKTTSMKQYFSDFVKRRKSFLLKFFQSL